MLRYVGIIQRTEENITDTAQNEFHRDHLMPDIVPTLLKNGIVKPNAQRVVEGKTLLERAQNALDALRRKEASGERLVWRVADTEQ